MSTHDNEGVTGGQVARRNVLKTLGIGGAVLAAAGFRPATSAFAQPAGDSAEVILNTAATAEALGTTLIYGIVAQSTYFSQLPAIHQDVLRAALTTEQYHLDALSAQGAKPMMTQFFMPSDLLQNLALFVTVGDFLETICVGAYLAATRRFAELGMPLMSEVAHQFGGSEAEHRVLVRALGRDVLNLPLVPNDVPWERPTLYQVSQAPQFLAPFLTGGSGFDRDFVGPMPLPDRAVVLAAGLAQDTPPLAVNAF